jgi:hypothetical protein
MPTDTFTSTFMALIKQFKSGSTILRGTLKKDLQLYSPDIDEKLRLAGEDLTKQKKVWDEVLKGSFLGSIIQKYIANLRPLSVGTDEIITQGYDEHSMINKSQIPKRILQTLNLLWNSISSGKFPPTDLQGQLKYFQNFLLDVLGAFTKTYALRKGGGEEVVATDIEKVPLVFALANESIGSFRLMKDGKRYKDTIFTMFNITENALKEYITLNTIDDMIAKKYPTAKFPEPKFGP